MNDTKPIPSPISVDWKVSEETLRNLNFCGISLPEKFTSIQGITYCAQMSCQKGRKIHLTLKFIFHQKLKESLQANYTFDIASANFLRSVSMICEGTGSCSIFLNQEDILNQEKNFIVDGFMYLKIRGTIQYRKYTLQIDSFVQPMNLSESLWNGDDKDFTIIVDGKAIMAHKCILAHRSKYFSAMFSAGWKENKENYTTIKEFSYSVVEAVVKACYDQDITEFLVKDNIIPLLTFLDVHEFQYLKGTLETYLIPKISANNVVTFANASLKSNTPKLQEECLHFLIFCMRNSVTVDDHVNLCVEFKDEIMKNVLSPSPVMS